MRRLPGWAIALGLLALAAGCTPADRHGVLTFFFTGVPPLDTDAPKTDLPAKQATANAAPIPEPTPINVPEPEFWVHGPFAAGACQSCHRVDDTGRVGFDRAGSSLIKPVGELCVGCHSDYDPEESDRRWLHGPVATGQCTLCHSPHLSPTRFMLRAKDSVTLCGKCHLNTALKSPPHQAPEWRDCRQCHNPHMGVKSDLLRFYYDESGHRETGR